MTAPTHPLVKAILDLTREIARQVILTGQTITPPPETILSAADARLAEQEQQ